MKTSIPPFPPADLRRGVQEIPLNCYFGAQYVEMPTKLTETMVRGDRVNIDAWRVWYENWATAAILCGRFNCCFTDGDRSVWFVIWNSVMTDIWLCMNSHGRIGRCFGRRIVPRDSVMDVVTHEHDVQYASAIDIFLHAFFRSLCTADKIHVPSFVLLIKIMSVCARELDSTIWIWVESSPLRNICAKEMAIEDWTSTCTYWKVFVAPFIRFVHLVLSLSCRVCVCVCGWVQLAPARIAKRTQSLAAPLIHYIKFKSYRAQ